MAEAGGRHGAAGWLALRDSQQEDAKLHSLALRRKGWNGRSEGVTEIKKLRGCGDLFVVEIGIAHDALG